MVIFADASAIISLFNERDSNHTKAKKLVGDIKSDSITTSNYVFSECVTVLSQKLDKKLAIIAGNFLRKRVGIIRIPKDIEEDAWEIFQEQRSKNVSFVDCTTFALFNHKAYDRCFTFDKDFKTNKIPVLEETPKKAPAVGPSCN